MTLDWFKKNSQTLWLLEIITLVENVEREDEFVAMISDGVKV